MKTRKLLLSLVLFVCVMVTMTACQEEPVLPAAKEGNITGTDDWEKPVV